MNDFGKGVFEALSWVGARMTELEDMENKWASLKTEVDEAIRDIRKGIGVDFRERLRALL